MAGARARALHVSLLGLFTDVGVCGLTPELSRPAERARRWFNHSASAETAKRARLERIVRLQILFLVRGQDKRSSRRQLPREASK